MMPMRRRTSSVVLAAGPPGGEGRAPWGLGWGRRIGAARTRGGTLPVLGTGVVPPSADDGRGPRLDGGRCHAARAAQVTTAHPDLVPLIVVGGTRANAR